MKTNRVCLVSAFLLGLLISAFMQGCLPWKVAPGADPAVVYAEQSAVLALDTFDAFVKYERAHEATLLKVNPAIHRTAEEIRKHGLGWIKELREATKQYKANRNDVTRTALITAQAFVDLALNEVRAHMTEGGFQ